MGGVNRDKFFTDDYGARNRMSSMNMNNPSHEDAMPNNRGGAGGGVNWLSH